MALVRPRGNAANWLLAACSTFVVLLVAEIGCRLAGYGGLEQYRADSELGWGVRGEEVYSQLLEQALNGHALAAGVRTQYEIVNAGVNAYNLAQVSGLMRRVVENYQPDGFLIAYTFNDGWNGVGHLSAQE